MFTILGVAAGATIGGLFGNFAYGIIGGMIIGMIIDLYKRFTKKKEEPKKKVVVPDKYAGDDDYMNSVNAKMRNTREVMNKRPTRAKMGTGSVEKKEQVKAQNEENAKVEESKDDEPSIQNEKQNEN